MADTTILSEVRERVAYDLMLRIITADSRENYTTKDAILDLFCDCRTAVLSGRAVKHG